MEYRTISTTLCHITLRRSSVTNIGLHRIMHRTVRVTGYIGPLTLALTLTLVCSSNSQIASPIVPSIISARQHICYSALYANAIARPSVRPSVTGVDQSKTVEVRITKPSPQSSPMTLVSWCLTSPWNSKGKIGSRSAEWHRGRKYAIFSP